MGFIQHWWFVWLAACAVLALMVAVMRFDLSRHLHAQLVQALGRQITVESSTALRSQLPEWIGRRLWIMLGAAALAGAMFIAVVFSVV